jgi:cytochrome c-type biogenesis protein CcmH
MGLWLALGFMTVIAVGLAVAPLVRRAQAAASRREYDLRVYRAQLAELAREQERGLLGEREAEAARLEVERRMLAADAADRERRQRSAARGRHWAIALALLVGLPALAGGLYAQLGSPYQPGAPFLGRAEERAQVAARQQGSLPSVETMIARLEAQLASNPTDLGISLRLGRAYALAGRFEESAESYREAISRHQDVAELHSALGEALVMASDGIVGPEARGAFDQALALDPGDARARFYGGLAMLQRGERQDALATWIGLVEDAPADAPWLPDLRQRTAALAEDLGLDPERTLPASRPTGTAATKDGARGPRGPDAEQMRAMEAMSPEERATMIRGMVDGLAARLEQQPDDVEGWRMLGRSFAALGEAARSAEAYRQVASRRRDDLTAQVEYAEALLAQGSMDQPLAPEAVAQLQEVLALDADHPLALFHLGRAAAARGDANAAARHWNRLLAQMPADAPARAQLERLLESLEADG